MDPISTRIALGAAGASGPSSLYWFSTLGIANTTIGNEVKVSNTGDIYIAGYTTDQGQGSLDALIAKYDSYGTLQWQRILGSSVADQFIGIDFDSLGDIYVVGVANTGGDALIAKYNSSGTIQWQRTLSGGSIDIAQGIVVDSSNNIYIAGYTASEGAGSNDFLIAKYDSSGNIQWQRTLGSVTSQTADGISVDTSGNIYIIGRSGAADGTQLSLFKYNSSGTFQWNTTLGISAALPTVGHEIVIDSANNIYVTGYTSNQGQGGNEALLAKYNTSGTLQWQRILGGASSDIAFGVALDTSGNIYIAGRTSSQGAGNNDFLIAKYNSSGTIQWQRTFGNSASNIANSIDLDSSNNICVLGSSGVFALLLKVPSDGSLTGTYGGYVYATSTLTAATSTLSTLTDSLTSSTSTLTSSASSLVGATSTLTSTTISI